MFNSSLSLIDALEMERPDLQRELKNQFRHERSQSSTNMVTMGILFIWSISLRLLARVTSMHREAIDKWAVRLGKKGRQPKHQRTPYYLASRFLTKQTQSGQI
jgi:hypothetical protein